MADVGPARQARADPRGPERAASRTARSPSDARIRASLPTHPAGARAGRRGDGHLAPRPARRRASSTPRISLAPVAARLVELLGTHGAAARDWLDGVDVRAGPASCCCENVRFNKGEKKDDEALAQQDGRAVRRLRDRRLRHRAPRRGEHARRRASSRQVACAGPLLAAELEALERALANPARPLVAIVAGSKVSTKLTVLEVAAAEGRPADRRRRHRQHVPARRGHADRQVAVRAGPRRPRRRRSW